MMSPSKVEEEREDQEKKKSEWTWKELDAAPIKLSVFLRIL